ncbi:unnamed protein product [Lymnaea stagnalis]|uniref:PDZ domain-containing protein n=1 Tax=Lymnaea stagnalis TaxID=6523 RepID=A0AAV2HM83_LYMST
MRPNKFDALDVDIGYAMSGSRMGDQSLTASNWTIGPSSTIFTSRSADQELGKPKRFITNYNKFPDKSSTLLRQGSGQFPRPVPVFSRSLPSLLTPDADTATSPRLQSGMKRVFLIRQRDGTLGLGIKGGKEYKTPVIVTEPGTQGESQGLCTGDRILNVNGMDFRGISHAEAVIIMQAAWNIIMIVEHPRLNGFEHPRLNGYHSSQSQEISDNSPAYEDLDLLLCPSKGGKLGCAVNRDANGCFIVDTVDDNSSAFKAGLCPGDHILEIEGIPVSFLTDKQVYTLMNSKSLHFKIRRISGKT